MKSCYDCKLHPTCYARIKVDEVITDLIKMFWLGLNSKEKIFKIVATHCSHYEQKEEAV